MSSRSLTLTIEASDGALPRREPNQRRVRVLPRREMRFVVRIAHGKGLSGRCKICEAYLLAD